MSELAFYNSTMSGLNGLGRVKGDIRDELVRNKPFVMAPVGDPRFPIGDPVVLEKIKANVLAKVLDKINSIGIYPRNNDYLKVFQNNPSDKFDIGDGYSVDTDVLHEYANLIRNRKLGSYSDDDVDFVSRLDGKQRELHDYLVYQALNSKYGDNVPKRNSKEISFLRDRIGDLAKEILGID
jgi:hypothetical protein